VRGELVQLGLDLGVASLDLTLVGVVEFEVLPKGEEMLAAVGCP